MLVRRCSAALLLTVVSACGDSASLDAGVPTSTSSPSTSSPSVESTDAPSDSITDDLTQSSKPKPGVRIVAADSEFGRMLFDRTGQAIYLFDVETTSRPTCYDGCAEAWPPVLTTGDPEAGRGVDDSLLDTTRRRDGTVQVTYNDHPLYFYAHEGKGEVKCHDVFLNGGKWYIVQPDGDPAPPG
jgi:predicted lipoprotein with Yx(FWY)xxD motif